MTLTPPQPYNIAIIGMGCIFPAADDLQGYWRLLLRGEDAITEVPPTHWRAEDYLDPEGKRPDHLYCTRGGYLPRVNFDPAEFGIPPANLEATDTSQLLGLITAKAALEDAGYGLSRTFDRRRASVILGVTGTQELVIPLAARLGHPLWRRALAACGLNDMQVQQVVERIAAEYVPWQENSFPGLLGNVVAGRICNRLDLGGTNCVVDAACASSFSALHLALLELATGRSDLVVTGGVDTLNDVFMHACFCEAHILSPRGAIRPFAANADGTLLGEGLGMLVLKRLADAKRDGDRIYAVIQGLGTSSDGRSQSIYSPRREGQVAALQAAYTQAGIGPAEVGLVEAHGTGTQVGDQVEFRALCDVYRESDTSSTGWCALGSVKSMIGHTKAAAGTAGLIKAVLALHHKVLPPTLHAEPPDERLHLDTSPFYLNTRLRPWLAPAGHPRRAAISAFGFGGSNYHAVVEEYEPQKRTAAWSGAVQILAFAADTPAELKTLLRRQQQHLREDWSSAELAVWAAHTRQAFAPEKDYRLLLVLEKSRDPRQSLAAQAMQEVQQALNWLEAPEDQPRLPHLFYGQGTPAPLAFLFPGQGSQYVDMGSELAAVFPEALSTLEALDHICRAEEGLSLSQVIYPRPAGVNRELRQQQETALRRTDVAQPAIGAISLAMLKTLRSFGLDAQAFCGHSYGEVMALHAAGAMDEDTFWRISQARGASMATADNGTMLAVNAPLAELEDLARRHADTIVLANRNAPRQGIFSGSPDAITQFEAVCRQKGYPTRLLPVGGAFHSPLMATAAQDFAARLADLPLRPLPRAVVSSMTGQHLSDDPEMLRSGLARQLTSPVDFVTAIQTLYQSGIRLFVEVGPKSVLTTLVQRILAEQDDAQALALDASAGRSSGLRDLAVVLARCAANGQPLDLTRWEPCDTAPRPAKRLQIPLCGANYRTSRPQPAPVVLSQPTAHAGVKVDGQPVMKAQKPAIPAPPDNVQHPDTQISGVQISELQKTDHQRTATCVQPAPSHQAPAGMPQSFIPETPITPMNSHSSNFSASQPGSPASSSGLPSASGCSSNVEPTSLQTALHTVQEGLHSLQALQRQTAETHQMFLQHQSESSRTLQQMMAGIQRLAENALGILPDQTPVRNIHQPEPFCTPPDVYYAKPAPPVREGTAHGISIPVTAPQTVTEAPAPSVTPHGHFNDAINKPVSQRAIQPAPAPAQPVNTSPAQAGIAPAALETHLLAVVSELTGYPVDMLGLDMDIEADLGIDSIKRVEILSALEERLPNLPAVSPEIMGTLKTLRQIQQQFEQQPEQKSNQQSDQPGPSASRGATSPDAFGASPAELPAPELLANLLAVVSELTGYPVDMLGLDMDIEADLGIDSIKRVEILSALEERMPHLPALSPEIMGTLKSLQQILDQIQHAAMPAAITNTPPATAAESLSCSPGTTVLSQPLSNAENTSTPSDNPPLPRQMLQVVPIAVPATDPIPLPKGHVIVVTGDDAPLEQAILDALQRQGLTAIQQPPKALLKALRNGPDELGAVSGLVIVAAARYDASDTAPSHAFLTMAFELARQAGPLLRAAADAGAGLLAAVTRLDGAFGCSNAGIANPFSGGLAGLIKTAALEWPAVTCRVLDVDAGWPLEDATASDVLVQALLASSQALPGEVGLNHRTSPPALQQLVLADVPPTVNTAPAALNLQPEDVVLVSGGARGVTAAAAHALAQACQPHLVLLGRSAEPFDEPDWLTGASDEAAVKQALLQHEFAGQTPTPRELEARFRTYWHNREIQANLQALRATGADVTYCQVDIRDAARVGQVVDRIREQRGPVRAVIHGAGVLADRLIEDKTLEQFQEVFDTKVKGLGALLAAVTHDPLVYLIGFSSVAARLGNIGQVDYAMANEVLNKVLQQEARQRPDCRVLALNWGPWDSGMVSGALKQSLQRRKIPLIPLADGAQALVTAMADGSLTPAVEIVIGSPLQAAPKAPAIPDGAPAFPKAPTISPEFTLTFKREIDLAGVPVLEAHQLNQIPVVPLALIAEWLGHGALHQHPGLLLHGLDDLQVLKGLRLDKPQRIIRILAGKADRRTAGSHRGGNGRPATAPVFEVPVELRDGFKHDPELVHTRARAILGDHLPEPPPFDDQRYRNAPPWTGTPEEAYAHILFHGKALQGLRDIVSLTPEFMEARIAAAPPPATWMQNPLRSRWIADPLVMDGAFQMAIIWCYEQLGKRSLPSFAARYRQYCRRFPAGDVRVIMDVTHTGEHKFKGDFTFLNADQQVLARLEGYEAVMDASLDKAFGY